MTPTPLPLPQLPCDVNLDTFSSALAHTARQLSQAPGDSASAAETSSRSRAGSLDYSVASDSTARTAIASLPARSGVLSWRPGMGKAVAVFNSRMCIELPTHTCRIHLHVPGAERGATSLAHALSLSASSRSLASAASSSGGGSNARARVISEDSADGAGEAVAEVAAGQAVGQQAVAGSGRHTGWLQKHNGRRWQKRFFVLDVSAVLCCACVLSSPANTVDVMPWATARGTHIGVLWQRQSYKGSEGHAATERRRDMY